MFVAVITVVALGVASAVLAEKTLGGSGRSELDLDPSKIATRIPAGRVGVFDNTSSKTFQATYELVGPFDAVRVVFGSDDQHTPISVNGAIVSVLSSDEDVNNSGGEWSPVTSQGEAEFAIPPAPNARGQLSYAVSDWIPIKSVARRDGSDFPLLTVRARMASTPELPVLGNGKDNFTNWADRADGGRKFWWRAQDGDSVSNPSTFTSAENTSQSPIFGVQYLCDDKVITVAAVGDSITEGRGTYIGEGFVMPVLEKLNSQSEIIKYEYANFGWSGQNPAQYAERALRLLDSDLKPDIMVFPAGSPNPASQGPLTDEATSKMAADRNSVVAAAQSHNVVPLIWTWLPTDATVRSYGTTDSKRLAYNAEVLKGARDGLLIADAAGPLSGPTIAGQVQMAEGLNKDGIHPNDAGNAVIGGVIKPALMSALQRFEGR
ncbi:SGNH/GDSL hydrolase family protein [Mycolicibacterium litorale]|uniref:SGNH/GDSL hydrolase family protein n=1 Tax=Mycolicibacterium litorale TaxID=758802 RepID=UPI003CF4405A